MVSVFTLSDAWNWLGSIPSTAGSPGEPVCRGVDLLPPGWNGRFPGGGVFGDAPRSTPSSGGSSPFGLRLVYRLARSPRLLFLELLPRSGSGWLRYLASCSVHPAPAWSPRGLRLRGCLNVVWLLVGWVAVRLWAFFLLGFHLAACFPYGWLVRQLGGLSPIFPFPFPLESLSLHGFWSGFCRGSPLRVVSSCSFLEGSLPLLWRWRVWMVESSRPMRSSGRFPWCLFASILFPSCATRGRFDVPGVLVSGSGLSASTCSHACGRFRGIALGPGDRSSPLDGCVYSLRFLLSSVASALSLLGSWAFLPPLSVSLLSVVVVPFLEETGRSSRRFYVFQSSTWWSSV